MFRKNMEEVLERNIRFTLDEKKKGALLHILGIGSGKNADAKSFLAIGGAEKYAVKPLEMWNFPEESQEYLEACIARDRARWEIREYLDDDTVPTMKPYYGIAIHTAFIGGEVTFGANSSYHKPLLDDYQRLDELELREDNRYFRLLLDSMEYLKKRGKEEGFLPSLRGGDSPLDIANAIRGNDLFLDFYEEEENVERLMEFCLKAARWTWKHQMEAVEEVAGGRMTGQAIWLPGNSIGHLSEDASSMCSQEMYETFGKPYLEGLMEDYDSAIIHVHTAGRHNLPPIASVEKMKLIQLEYDPQQPAPIEVYKANEAILKDKIVVPIMTTDEIEENLEFLAEHKSIVQLYAASLEDAERAVNLIRSIR
ncbi:MAG: uroporphyrinogen decarboxylase family protein [Eubacteriales bacterium]|nr:uroporphyrinogen decarboxylase family protein [Eubacteriales bacterium]